MVYNNKHLLFLIIIYYIFFIYLATLGPSCGMQEL